MAEGFGANWYLSDKALASVRAKQEHESGRNRTSGSENTESRKEDSQSHPNGRNPLMERTASLIRSPRMREDFLQSAEEGMAARRGGAWAIAWALWQLASVLVRLQ